MALLEVQSITKRFGGLVAVNKLDLSVDAGQIVGLIGPNGAGKTTVFNVIAGFYKADEGQVLFNGENIGGLRTDQICKKGLTRTFQIVKPFPELSLLNNVMVGAYNRSSNKAVARKKAEEVLGFIGMSQISDMSAGSLPVGGRKRLEIAKALATDPEMILLDEVMAGLRPGEEMDEMIDVVRKISERGIGIVIVEHVMKVMMTLAERIVVIHHGFKIAEGTPSEITQEQAVIDAYLGEVRANAKS